MGLFAFAAIGATIVVEEKYNIHGVYVVGLVTSIGGGVIRDLLAGRRPLVLYEKMYAVWPMLAGIIISLGWADSQVKLYVLFFMMVLLKMISDLYQWSSPVRKRKRKLSN